MDDTKRYTRPDRSMSRAATRARVFEAALDQPNPTPELRAALNDHLTVIQHPLRDHSRDPHPSAVAL